MHKESLRGWILSSLKKTRLREDLTALEFLKVLEVTEAAEAALAHRCRVKGQEAVGTSCSETKSISKEGKNNIHEENC